MYCMPIVRGAHISFLQVLSSPILSPLSPPIQTQLGVTETQLIHSNCALIVSYSLKVIPLFIFHFRLHFLFWGLTVTICWSCNRISYWNNMFQYTEYVSFWYFLVLVIMSQQLSTKINFLKLKQAVETRKPQADTIMEASTFHVQQYNGNVLMKVSVGVWIQLCAWKNVHTQVFVRCNKVKEEIINRYKRRSWTEYIDEPWSLDSIHTPTLAKTKT